MEDIGSEIGIHSVLGMQISYLEEIQKVISLSNRPFLSLSIFAFTAGMLVQN